MASEPTSGADAQSQGGVTPLSIVALDDDADFREFITSMLQDEGHSVTAIADPASCYDAIESGIPDLLLLDMKMGRHTGEEVLEEVRVRWPKLCVVVMTGFPSLDGMRQTFKRDVFDYVAKPFGIEELRRVLSQATEELGLGVSAQDRLRIELGRQIRISRTQKGWTLRELSERSGVSVSQLSSVERGAHLPSMESLLLIASALGAKASDWLSSAGF